MSIDSPTVSLKVDGKLILDEPNFVIDESDYQE